MKLGAVFPTTDIGNDPVAIRDWAQTAEELGYEHILTFDHVLGAEHADREPRLVGPYTEHDPFHEPMTLLAYLAGVTQRIELATGVIILPQRQTVLAAKQAAEIDLLSGGRLRFGVGTGWSYVEYEALGVPFEGRGKRFDEQIELMRQLWAEPLLDFEGDYHRVDRAGLLPRPTRPIPIWFGAISRVPIRRAARIGDGILFGSAPSKSTGFLDEAFAELDRLGRSRDAFGAEAMVDFSYGEETWQEEIALWERAGGTHLSLRAMDTAVQVVGGKPMGYSGPQDYIDALRKFKEALG
ncbi:MAG: LLM class F420-dependent oxidoreductase [Deltaproteobacteria bacterium]|nr:LLM class F420-dependent oxidoreductase [Deltaproteobacteria bacterium]